MDTIEPHPHDFAEESWPFNVPVNLAAFSTIQVIRDRAPVLVVYHDHDGDWQFLHSDDAIDEDDCLLICMGCAYQHTPVIAELAAMPPGWRALRKSAASPWISGPYQDSDDEAQP